MSHQTSMKRLFKRLGTNEREMETFLRLLETGPQPASAIAKRVGVPRSTMYLILDKLKNLHLVEEFEQGGMKFFRCIPVREIADLLHVRKKDIEATQQMLDKRLEDLERLENKLSITPQVKFYEGKMEVMRMYEQVLKETSFCAFQNPELVKQMMPVYHVDIPETLKRSKGKARELLIDCPEAYRYQKLYHSDQHQIRVLKDVEFFPSDIIICSSKIYMISYGESLVSATEVTNRALAQSQQVIFDQLWQRHEHQ